jgi:hypothetical protein
MPEPHAAFGGQRQSMITWPESERSLAVFRVGIRTHLASILALPARHLAWEEGAAVQRGASAQALLCDTVAMAE